ncbi:ABC-type uncharacterized transport system [Striga asiatica]|uniref:ABC-type uncharacterized transport system n=1 Tax=Striga asiatica TaxID=4170 RepID=A0A5A7R6A2_STRAF|nr:ABC-type uncharacterized transport system [Striga asiatica]
MNLDRTSESKRENARLIRTTPRICAVELENDVSELNNSSNGVRPAMATRRARLSREMNLRDLEKESFLMIEEWKSPSEEKYVKDGERGSSYGRIKGKLYA